MDYANRAMSTDVGSGKGFQLSPGIKDGHPLPGGDSKCPQCGKPLYYSAHLQIRTRIADVELDNQDYCSGGCGFHRPHVETISISSPAKSAE